MKRRYLLLRDCLNCCKFVMFSLFLSSSSLLFSREENLIQRITENTVNFLDGNGDGRIRGCIEEFADSTIVSGENPRSRELLLLSRPLESHGKCTVADRFRRRRIIHQRHAIPLLQAERLSRFSSEFRGTRLKIPTDEP